MMQEYEKVLIIFINISKTQFIWTTGSVDMKEHKQFFVISRVLLAALLCSDSSKSVCLHLVKSCSMYCTLKWIENTTLSSSEVHWKSCILKTLWFYHKWRKVSHEKHYLWNVVNLISFINYNCTTKKYPSLTKIPVKILFFWITVKEYKKKWLYDSSGY